MIDYLTHTMGKPDLIVNNPKQSDFIGKKGIIVVKRAWLEQCQRTRYIMEWQYLFRSVPLIK
ncbi:Type VI secretion system-associated protein [Salmonella enterica subsp. enterica]|uniref:Type VI secretion system-associated protein n=1 Tax=Salmonella enterica I TaxID=59201 RepID=A0A379X009_SALET|nr:Type VI secretion system-associated protein [Salmonella enterica subsp. enterica]